MILLCEARTKYPVGSYCYDTVSWAEPEYFTNMIWLTVIQASEGAKFVSLEI